MTKLSYSATAMRLAHLFETKDACDVTMKKANTPVEMTEKLMVVARDAMTSMIKTTDRLTPETIVSYVNEATAYVTHMRADRVRKAKERKARAADMAALRELGFDAFESEHLAFAM